MKGKHTLKRRTLGKATRASNQIRQQVGNLGGTGIEPAINQDFGLIIKYGVSEKVYHYRYVQRTYMYELIPPYSSIIMAGTFPSVHTMLLYIVRKLMRNSIEIIWLSISIIIFSFINKF